MRAWYGGAACCWRGIHLGGRQRAACDWAGGVAVGKDGYRSVTSGVNLGAPRIITSAGKRGAG
jgi:hypothetical protein